MSSLLFNAAFAFYAVGLFHSVIAFVSKRSLFYRIAVGSEAVGFALHTAFLLALAFEIGGFPITNLRVSLSFFAWTVSLCFQIMSWRYGINPLGLFSLPLVTILMLGTVTLKSYPTPEILKNSWIYWHTTFLILAYGMFFVTFIASVLYLVQQKEIKNRRPRVFYHRLPSLLAMDNAFQHFLMWGFCFMTLGLMAGVIRAEAEWLGGWLTDPKVVCAFATWLIYLVLIFLRLSAGWRGKRAALMSLFGFLSVLFTFLGVRMFFGGLHVF